MHHEEVLPCCCPGQPTTGQFTKFQRLPPEIRNMIWESAMPEPRVYEVLDAPNAKQKTPAREGLMFANIHPEPPPALAAPLTLGRTTKFVDVSRDILLLEPYLLVKRLHRTLHFMSQIPLVRDYATRLALGTSYGIYPGIFHPVLGRKVSKNNMGKLLGYLAKFARLKTLIFVVHQEFQFEFDFRFPGTLTPIPPVSGYGLPPTVLSPSYSAGVGGLTPAGYPSPPNPAKPSLSGNSFPTASTPLSTGLPTPANSTTASPLPPPALPLPPISTLPLPYPLHQPQAPQAPQPHATLQPLLSPPPQQQPPSTTPSISSLQPTTSSASSPSVQPRPQQIHQAYRFKFDIESNINAPPRRPHTNELLYYPLAGGIRMGMGMGLGGDEFDAYEAYVNGSGSGGGVGVGVGKWDCHTLHDDIIDNDDEEGEWCDPWPTNDDWKRFRRRWVRGMVAACALPPAEGEDQSPLGGDEKMADGGGLVGRGNDKTTCGVSRGKQSKGKGRAGEQKLYLPKWKLMGASLLWRYTKGVGGG
ncbi:hypothetical protein B0J18DRAFT_445714 [Chaetomium sp. MPI-SDFR-AT-0129]|nr:hypothetical protein B0J18DRAFT_445714 [Chaetomium sp. MPI-SDFR-AT-0129]